MDLIRNYLIYILIVICVLFISTLSFSMILSDKAIIPIVAYAPGAYGTFWKTDLCIFNSMDTEIEVTVEFYSGDSAFYDSKVFSILAKNTKCIKNFVYELFNYQGYGMIYLTTDDVDNEMGVWSRIYTEREDGGTYGQAIDNQLIFSNIRSSYLFGITKNNDLRTNLGICCLLCDSSFDVELYNKTGILLKKYKINVPYNGVLQFAIDIEVENGWARIIPAEDKIVYYAYMSLVDNKTGDAVFMPASRKISE